MIKILIGNIKREIKSIADDLMDIYYKESSNILMYGVSFLLGIVVTLTYGNIFGGF